MAAPLYVKEGRRYRLARPQDVGEWQLQEAQARMIGQAITSPADSQSYLMAALQSFPSECFAAVFLDNRHRVIRFEVLFKGTVDNTTVYPREVVRRAMECNAAAVIFAHNHPSGVAEPSDADRLITRRLRDALELVDVRTLDHFVVGATSCVSLASRGLL